MASASAPMFRESSFLTGCFITPQGRLECYWNRRERLYDLILYKSNGTTVHSNRRRDKLVIDSIAEVLGWDSAEVILMDMFVFEEPYHGYAADSELLTSFYHCDWSDYGNDLMRVEGVIVRRDELIEKYQAFVADASLRRLVA